VAGEALAIIGRSILHAAIGTMNETGGLGLAIGKRGIEMGSQRPAHDLAREAVENDGASTFVRLNVFLRTHEIVNVYEFQSCARCNAILSNNWILFYRTAIPVFCGVQVTQSLVAFRESHTEITCIKRLIAVSHKEVNLDCIDSPAGVDQFLRSLFQYIEVKSHRNSSQTKK
jgi:hypothetical protein